MTPQSVPANTAPTPQAKLLPNPKARLQDQFHEVARFKHVSWRTESTYWQWVVRYLRMRDVVGDFLRLNFDFRQFLKKADFAFVAFIVNRRIGNVTAHLLGAVYLHDGGAGFDFQRPGLGCHSFLHVYLTRNVQLLDFC